MRSLLIVIMDTLCLILVQATGTNLYYFFYFFINGSNLNSPLNHVLYTKQKHTYLLHFALKFSVPLPWK